MDSAEFFHFRNFLEESYPLVHANLKRIVINEFSLIYEWKGKDSSLAPYILLAHSDVVPVEPESVSLWKAPPFGGEIKNDTVWGRGTVDDKGSLIAILEAAEYLQSQKFQPDRTIYFCFGHDEEASGIMGAKEIVSWLKQQNVRAQLVLDEGLEVMKKNYSGFKNPVALIGVGEKGYASFELTVQKPGGHSSVPEHETSIDILIKGLARLQKNQMPAKLIRPVREFLQGIKPNVSPSVRFAINHQWLFKRALIRHFQMNPVTNAIVRTTIVTTVINSGVKDNVIPSVAKAIVNSRILPGETTNDVENFITHTINDPRILIRTTGHWWNPSGFTSTAGAAFRRIQSLVKEFFPGANPVPFIVIGATDSRYYRSLSDGVINFNPVIDSQGFHGINERRSIADFERMIHFYIQLIKNPG
jgi:carboxypeptidase PM20D1